MCWEKNQQRDWFKFILYMKMKQTKRNSCMLGKESANGLVQVHIINENEENKKK